MRSILLAFAFIGILAHGAESRAETLPLGSYVITAVDSSNCSAAPNVDGLTIDLCATIDVTCASTPELVATVKLTLPVASPSTGTLLWFNGLDGTGFPQGYGTIARTTIAGGELARGHRVVQLSWASGIFAGTNGININMCRAATAIHAIKLATSGGTKLHEAGSMLNGAGNSGGSDELIWPLAHYGAGDDLDCAVLSSGPPIASIKEACEGTLLLGWAAEAHDLRSGGSIGYTPLSASTADTAWGHTACAQRTGGGLDQWEANSLMNGVATRVYPATSVECIFAMVGDQSEAVPVGLKACNAIPGATVTQSNDPLAIHEMPTVQVGADLINTALGRCVYRHAGR